LVYLDLAKWTNQEVEKIAADCAKETCLTWSEAIAYGFADKLYTSKGLKEMEETLCKL
jgi:ATP-dependent protease ClpP protease subunit